MSNLSDFLTTDYVAHFGVTWNAATMSLRTECPASICFEIEDKKPSIVQPSGQRERNQTIFYVLCNLRLEWSVKESLKQQSDS